MYQAYEYLCVLDEDAVFDYTDPKLMVETLERYQIHLAQSAMHASSTMRSHKLTMQLLAYDHKHWRHCCEIQWIEELDTYATRSYRIGSGLHGV